jgi:2-polyprenyl-6-methoxyphenol hydroxylase-like FAD-dependent oxidoreductase
MPAVSYDLITIGGGLGGASLAKAMAERGARVLVLEREPKFKDRVRGEQMHPWGVAEAKLMGIYDLLRATCGHEVQWFDTYLGPQRIMHRDLSITTPQQTGEMAFYHPTMQEVLLRAASGAGAEVRRPAIVREVTPGMPPSVTVEQDGRIEEIRARLVVGADGRSSPARRWGGFVVRRDPERRLIGGLLFDEMPAPEDTSYLLFNPAVGHSVPIFPQGKRRVRAYFVYQRDEPRFQGDADIPRFVQAAIHAGAPAEYYANARPAGPLASFNAADTWVDHPYRNRIALVGDAAASNDPAYGEGLSLTLRDVRLLRDALLRGEDWDAAGHEYATAHDRDYGVIHTVTSLFGEIFYATGPEADARRARVLPMVAENPTLMPDHLFCGPDLPLDGSLRQELLGEA